MQVKRSKRHMTRGDIEMVNEEVKSKEKASAYEERMDILREDSGEFCSRDKLTSLFYMLLRDHLPAGDLEKLVIDVANEGDVAVFTNGFLAKYAENLSDYLRESRTGSLAGMLEKAMEQDRDGRIDAYMKKRKERYSGEKSLCDDPDLVAEFEERVEKAESADVDNMTERERDIFERDGVFVKDYGHDYVESKVNCRCSINCGGEAPDRAKGLYSMIKQVDEILADPYISEGTRKENVDFKIAIQEEINLAEGKEKKQSEYMLKKFKDAAEILDQTRLPTVEPYHCQHNTGKIMRDGGAVGRVNSRFGCIQGSNEKFGTNPAEMAEMVEKINDAVEDMTPEDHIEYQDREDRAFEAVSNDNVKVAGDKCKCGDDPNAECSGNCKDCTCDSEKEDEPTGEKKFTIDDLPDLLEKLQPLMEDDTTRQIAEILKQEILKQPAGDERTMSESDEARFVALEDERVDERTQILTDRAKVNEEHRAKDPEEEEMSMEYIKKVVDMHDVPGSERMLDSSYIELARSISEAEEKGELPETKEGFQENMQVARGTIKQVKKRGVGFPDALGQMFSEISPYTDEEFIKVDKLISEARKKAKKDKGE